MKKILLSSIVAFGLISSLNAYELDKDKNLNVQWTGYKLPAKVGVSGTFKDVQVSAIKNDSLSEFLKSAKAKIKTASFDSKNPGRDISIVGSLFSLASSEFIEGSVVSVDEKAKTLVLDFVMNKISKQVPMSYEIKDNQITAKGKIDILDFAMDKPFAAFAKKCEALHQGVSYSEVAIEFTLSYK